MLTLVNNDFTWSSSKIWRNWGERTRTEMNGSNCSCMFWKNSNRSCCHETPNTNDFICWSCCKQFIVITNSHVRYLSTGASKREVKTPIVGSPHFNQKIISPSEHKLTGLVKQETKDGAQVPETSSLKLQSAVHTCVNRQRWQCFCGVNWSPKINDIELLSVSLTLSPQELKPCLK